jgi:enoyl-CoA hydratase/carnithine racemase
LLTRSTDLLIAWTVDRRRRKEWSRIMKTLIFEKREAVGIITLNRPSKMNALNAELMAELDEILRAIAGDNTIRAVILTGGEKVFAAGADISELAAITTSVDAHPFAEKAQALFKKLAELPQPVIAAVGGPALGGGCELAMSCDLRIASENASFGLPEVKLGLLPGGGGTQRLPRLVGPAAAKELLFCGDPIGAAEAYRIGLVNRVSSPDRLMEEAMALAGKLAERPRFALQTIKRLVNEGLNMDLHSALAHESRCFEILFSTDDQKEGLKAFMEKRKPVFHEKE